MSTDTLEQPIIADNKPQRRVLPAKDYLYRSNVGILKEKNIDIETVLEKFPEKPLEIDLDIKLNPVNNPAMVIIVGFSTRAIYDKVYNSIDVNGRLKHAGNIFIIEPDLGIFNQTIRRHFIGDIVNNPKVELILGVKPEEIGPYLYKSFLKVDADIGSRCGRALSPEVYFDPFAYPSLEKGKRHPVIETIIQEVQKTSKALFNAMGCASDSHYRWEQMWRNRENLQSKYEIKHLFNKFAEVPTIVVGGGPSVNEFISACEKSQIHKKALIIACDAVLPKLLSHGIKPHIVTRCERKLTHIFKDVKKEETKGIFYAAYPWCSPEFFDLFEDGFMLFRDNGVCKWTGYEPGSVNGGVSSANAALELALLLGAKKIFLTGIDLCFLDGRSHVEGTQVEFDIDKSKPKWTDIPNNSGEMVKTIPVWARCLEEYRGALFKWAGSGSKVYNTSLRGAHIQGAEPVSWEDAGQHFPKEIMPRERICKFLVLPSQSYKENFEKRVEDTKDMLGKVKEDIERLFSTVQDQMEIALREERKIMNAIKIPFEPVEFFNLFELARPDLRKIYEDPCRTIDAFKMKWLANPMFSDTLVDLSQSDYFQMENKLTQVHNSNMYEHERLKSYVKINLSYIRIVEFYANRILNMLTTGEISNECDAWDKSENQEKQESTLDSYCFEEAEGAEK